MVGRKIQDDSHYPISRFSSATGSQNCGMCPSPWLLHPPFPSTNITGRIMEASKNPAEGLAMRPAGLSSDSASPNSAPDASRAAAEVRADPLTTGLAPRNQRCPLQPKAQPDFIGHRIEIFDRLAAEHAEILKSQSR
ncbi:hypothetical protein BT67DRAFT_230349 [Trichocladium antarcticum]|uniref:Uncharacterized protein n=1 Tax=Trichocladium antarcticum TaxID=1450529 RepID=A0AAN6ZEE5_9PEZI|nr:hypothetical protein BT67DRAFT_230349 [Trichocladium antarcticum]